MWLERYDLTVRDKVITKPPTLSENVSRLWGLSLELSILWKRLFSMISDESLSFERDAMNQIKQIKFVHGPSHQEIKII